ncbi:MAG: septum formation initiator family protein [Parcubacteria group bacterium]|nr:septum formation initiator family protein [Parcubacteria group bacterium]
MGLQALVRSISLSKITTIVGVVLTVLFTVGVIQEAVRRERIDREINRREQEIAKLTQENDDLARLTEYFKTDDAKEREARRQLNVKRPGERVIVLPEIEPTTLGVTTETSGGEKPSETDELPPLKAWWDYFFAPREMLPYE